MLLNLQLFLIVLGIRDQLPWLNDERVSLTLGDKVRALNNPLFISSPDVSTAEPNCWRLTNRLIEKLNEPYVTRTHETKATQLRDRIKKNQKELIESLDAKVLFGSMKNYRGFVIGAGPSLDKKIDYISETTQKMNSREYCLISVDVATPALLAKGIVPNFIVTLDEKITKHHILKDENKKNLSETKLLHSLFVNDDILKKWHGNRFLFTTHNELEFAPAALKKTTCLFSGGSVIHPATDLALNLGCARVTFFGTDFGFPLDKTHAHWKNDELLQYDTRGRVYVLNGNGEKIPSTSSFSSYLVYLEHFLKTNPAIYWYNSSKIGADIEGINLDPEIIEWENGTKK